MYTGFYIRLTATAFFWSLAFFSVTEVVQHFPVFLSAFFRFLFAGLFLSVLTQLYGAWPSLRTWKARIDLLFLGFVGVFLYNLCFFTGIKLSDPVTGSLIVAANPAVTALISSLWKREHSSIRRWLGIAISFIGLLLVFSQGSFSVIAGLDFRPGDLFIFGASICWAFYSVKGKEVLASQPVLGTTTLACIIGAVLLLPPGLLEAHGVLQFFDSGTSGPSGGGPLEGISVLLEAEHAFLWLHLMYLGFFASGVAFLFWYMGVRALGAPRASIFINLVPVFAMLISIFLGKWPHVYQWLGALVVLTGVYITSTSTAPSSSASPAAIPDASSSSDS